MTSAKKFGLPPEFDKLQSFEFSRVDPTSPDESTRVDKIFRVTSLDDLAEKIERRVDGSATSPTSSASPPANRRP
jgi:hypothetical protein